MSKSILVVICDFLLLSLLSLVSFESKPDKTQSAMPESDIVQSFSDAQLVDLLKTSLEKEKERSEALGANIENLSDAVQKTKEQSERQRKLLDAREKEIQNLAKTKAELEKEKTGILEKSKSLETRVKEIDDRNAALHGEILTASQRLANANEQRVALEKKLGDMREVDSASQARLLALQEELKRNKDHLENLKTESDKLKNENKAMELEKYALSTQLEVAATKSKIYEENLKRAQAMVELEKSEKQKIQEHADILAVGVGELAASQQKLTKNIDELRPRTASEIFETVKNSLVTVNISYSRKGLFGDSQYLETLRAAPFVAADGKVWLVCNVSNTVLEPLTNRPSLPPETLSVSVLGQTHKFAPKGFYAVKQDPRLIALPVPAAFIEKENIKAFNLAGGETFKFSDCVVVEPVRFYYGQTGFKLDPQNADYADMDVGLFEVVFGDFSPSKGDIVMSRSGEFLGCMVNYSEAALLRNFMTLSFVELGAEYNKDALRNYLSETSARLRDLPMRLK